MAIPLGAALIISACARQGEGERCDFNNSGNDDCESGLVCVPSDELLDNSTDRCCPPNGYTDDRCIRKGTTGTGGTDGGTDSGSGGAAGAAGSAGAAGASGGGGASGSAGQGGSGGMSGSAGQSGSAGSDAGAQDASTD